MSGAKRVGYWISEKKGKKLNFDGFVEYCRTRNTGLELIKIDLDRNLEEQGPFDVIIHKLTDVIVKAETGCEREIQQIQTVQAYCKAHPSVVLLDPIVHVKKLLDRFRQYNTVLQCPILSQGGPYTIPPFVELKSEDVNKNLAAMKQAKVTFPVVCKPLLAHGFSTAHQMALVFNKEGLADIQTPCVAQTFINHDAIMYKIFVIGESYSIVERPSLKNFTAADQKTIKFDSHDISKANASSSLVQSENRSAASERLRPDDEVLFTLSKELQRTFQLNLFGIDVIVDKATGAIAIIDINAFPGYDGVDDMFPSMSRLIHQIIDKKKKTFQNNNNSSNGCTEKTNGTTLTHNKDVDTHNGHVDMHNGIEQSYNKDCEPLAGDTDRHEIRPGKAALQNTFRLESNESKLPVDTYNSL